MSPEVHDAMFAFLGENTTPLDLTPQRRRGRRVAPDVDPGGAGRPCETPTMAAYDVIGRTYAATRQPDPRIAARINGALGDASTVMNVGAGTGSYEPPTAVVAIEPSQTMIDQRPAGSAPALCASAECIPVDDNAVDAAMTVLTVHHWGDLDRGLAEMKRVARRRVVILTYDETVTREFWLLR